MTKGGRGGLAGGEGGHAPATAAADRPSPLPPPSSPQGVVAKLVRVADPGASTALEVAAGGKLYQVGRGYMGGR